MMTFTGEIFLSNNLRSKLYIDDCDEKASSTATAFFFALKSQVSLTALNESLPEVYMYM